MTALLFAIFLAGVLFAVLALSLIRGRDRYVAPTLPVIPDSFDDLPGDRYRDRPAIRPAPVPLVPCPRCGMLGWVGTPREAWERFGLTPHVCPPHQAAYTRPPPPPPPEAVRRPPRVLPAAYARPPQLWPAPAALPPGGGK